MTLLTSSQTLASSHFDTRFLKINVDNAPFLVTKLKVQVLPCVLVFVDGINKDRILGFEGLGGGDDVSTPQLEKRLLQAGVLVRQKIANSRPVPGKSTARSSRQQDDDYDDDEWD